MSRSWDVVARLSHADASASELAAAYSMALPSFLQHLKVLEGSGLVRSHKRGRVRTYCLVAKRVTEAEGWLAEQRDIWTARVDRFAAYVEGGPGAGS